MSQIHDYFDVVKEVDATRIRGALSIRLVEEAQELAACYEEFCLSTPSLSSKVALLDELADVLFHVAKIADEACISIDAVIGYAHQKLEMREKNGRSKVDESAAAEAWLAPLSQRLSRAVYPELHNDLAKARARYHNDLSTSGFPVYCALPKRSLGESK